MKEALDEGGAWVHANPHAPDQALCPSCGGVVILRQRRRSKQPGDVSYFWRHQDKSHIDCPGRFQGGRQTRAQTSRYSRRYAAQRGDSSA